MERGRRIFIELDDPEPWLRQLLRGQGAFVPTRLSLDLGEVFNLSARLPQVSQPLDLPVRVLGRRVPRGAKKLLAAGVVVHLADPHHPTARLLLDLARGDVVDFQARLRERIRTPARTVIGSEDELLEVVRRLLDDDEHLLLPIDAPAQPGDRLRLSLCPPDPDARADVEVEVRGVVLRDGERSVRCRLLGDHGRDQALSVLGQAGRRHA